MADNDNKIFIEKSIDNNNWAFKGEKIFFRVY